MGKKAAAYNMYVAKTMLSQLVEKAKQGQEVILMNRGEPVAKVVAIRKERPKRNLGFLRGKIKLLPGWDRPIEDFADY